MQPPPSWTTLIIELLVTKPQPSAKSYRYICDYDHNPKMETFSENLSGYVELVNYLSGFVEDSEDQIQRWWE